jgi:hypothetical protein
MHSTNNLEDGYLGSGKILGYSRHKYGDENHVKEILEFCSSRDGLKQREKEIVNEELLSQPLNINLKYGGDGGRTHKPVIAFHKAGGAKSGAKNLAKARAALQNPEAKKQAYAKMVANTESFARMTGKKHSEKTRKQMSESGCGERNSQFGTCWVTNGIKPIKIKKEQLCEYLMRGYSRGRK